MPIAYASITRAETRMADEVDAGRERGDLGLDSRRLSEWRALLRDAGGEEVETVALPAAGIAVHALRQAGIRTLKDLERLAMLHPNVGRELMARVGPNGEVGPVRQRRLATAISAVLGASAVRQTSRVQ